MITRTSSGIRIEGHRGTWYVIDEGSFVLTPDTQHGPQTFYEHCFLLEHEQHGDHAPNLIVNQNGKIITDDVYNGFGDLEDGGWARVTPSIQNEKEDGDGDDPREKLRMRTNYQVMPAPEEDGKYAPNYDALVATASCGEEADYIRSVAERGMRFAYNMVYVTQLTCGHFEIFQCPQNEHYSLDRVLEEARSYAAESKCTRCIGGW